MSALKSFLCGKVFSKNTIATFCLATYDLPNRRWPGSRFQH